MDHQKVLTIVSSVKFSVSLFFIFLYFSGIVEATDTTKINNYLVESLSLIGTDDSAAESLSNKALSDSKKIGYSSGEASAQMRLGIIRLHEGKNLSALSHFRKALEIRKSIHDQKGTASAFREISYVYRATNNLDSAFYYCIKAMTIYENLQDGHELAINYLDLGTLYLDYNNSAKSKYYFDKALDLFESKSDTTFLGMAYNSLGLYYFEQNENLRAIANFEKALQSNLTNGQLYSVTQNYSNIAACYVNLKQYAKAKTYYNRSLQYYNENGFQYEKAIVLNAIGKLFQSAGQKDSAIFYLYSGINVAKETGDLDLQSRAYGTLSEIYQNSGEYEKSLETSRISSALNDSIINTEKVEQIAEMQTLYETDKKDREIRLLNNENELKSLESKSRQVKLNFALYFLVIIGSFLGLVYFQKQKLAKAKAKSDTLVVEKELLIKEIHHRVKNNLEVISSLLELQSFGINDAVAKAAVIEGRSRVQSISLIHHKLYATDELASIEFKQFSEELFEQISKVFTKPGFDVQLNIRTIPLLLSADIAVPIGLILNELITNSFKYAIQEGKLAIITISLQTTETPEMYKLIYSDNGDGIPEAFNAATATSLGIKVIRLLTRQIGGNLEYYNSNGSVFEIPFYNK